MSVASDGTGAKALPPTNIRPGAPTLSAIGNRRLAAGIWALLRAPFRHRSGVLFVVSSGLGNAVMSIPALLEMKRVRPEVRRVLVGGSGPMELLGVPELGEEFHTIPRGMGLLPHAMIGNAQILKRYEVTLVTYSSMNLGVCHLKRLGLSGVLAGYSSSGPLVGADIVLETNKIEHEIEQNLDLLRATGTHAKDQLPDLFLRDAEMQDARLVLEKNRLRPRSFVAIHGGLCPGSAIKALPLPLIRALLASIERELGETAVLVCGPEESGFVAWAGGRMAIPADKIISDILSVRTLAAFLSLASVVVSADTGVGHIAAAVGTPVVSCFGPTSRVRCTPRGVKVRIVESHSAECRECAEALSATACLFDRECLNSVSTRDVLGAISELLRSP